MLHRQFEVVFQLLDIAAFFTAFHAFRTAVVHQPDVLRPLDHAVEIVRPYGVLVLVGGQAEAFPELRRNEGRGVTLARESALVGAQDHQVPEIQRAGFQRSHDLQALQGFSPEGDRLPLQQAVQHPQPGGGQQRQVHIGHHVKDRMVTLGKVQFQHHFPLRAQMASQVAHNGRKILLQRMVLPCRCLFGFRDHRPEKLVQQGTTLKILQGDVVFGLPFYGCHFFRLLRGEDEAEKAGGKDGVHTPVVEIPAFLPLSEAQLHLPHGFH